MKKKNIENIILIILTIILIVYIIKIIISFINTKTKTKFPKQFIERNNIKNNKNNKKRQKKQKIESFTNNLYGRFMFYSKNNCGNCEQIKEEWDKLLASEDDKECNKMINGCRINNKLIQFVYINCDDDENSCQNITNFPTFILETIQEENKVKEYKGAYTMENMKQWLRDQTSVN